MISLFRLFESANVALSSFDRPFHKTIDIPNKHYDISQRFDTPNSWWFTVLYDGKKAATVGVIVKGPRHFFQVAVHQNFRRKGLVKICADLMFQRFPKTDQLFSVIDRENIASIKAHKKAGFKKTNRTPMTTPGSDLYVKER